MQPNGRLFTSAEVAEKLGRNVQTIRKYIRLGKLQAIRFDKDYRITEEQLKAYLANYVQAETLQNSLL